MAIEQQYEKYTFIVYSIYGNMIILEKVSLPDFFVTSLEFTYFLFSSCNTRIQLIAYYLMTILS